MEAEILSIELDLMRRGKEDIIESAARHKTYRDLLLLCYQSELRKGMKRIEDLEPEYKNQIWAETKKSTAGMNIEECKDLARIVYLISEKI